jgi:hypothetical protein
VAALAALSFAVPAAVSAAQPAPKKAVRFSCTINHWIRDVSNGNRLVGISVSGGLQLAETPTTGYPANFIFELCSDGNGQYYLQDQIPGAGTPFNHPWVGVNVADHYAITATAIGAGPHEGFAPVCAGKGQEYIHWALAGSDMFTIATQPPTMWTQPPASGLPGTLYNISGVC